jgi:uncharacterized protein YfaP (DUF2135 family)
MAARHAPAAGIVVALALVLSLSLAAPASRAAPEVELQRPSGGWTYHGLTDDPGQVTYAYPNNLVDRGGQRGRTLIEGRLAALPRDQRRPPTIVVNGNAMPLYSGEDGRFARPYVFGSGSNGIEIKATDGRSLKRVQFYEANRTLASARIRVILAWDDPHAELDLHVLTPDGQHAFWANPVLQGGGGLDVDSVDGAGPEMFSVAAPLPGAYLLYVNYWGRFGAEGYHFDENAREREVITARVTLVQDENTGAEKRETWVVPMRKIGELALVRAFRRP